MLQAAERTFSPAAIHDTVNAALSDPAFKRSLQASIADRLLGWLRDLLVKFNHLMRDLPSSRTIGMILVGGVVVFVILRTLIVRRARDVESPSGRARRHGSARNDPWLDAQRLEADGDFEAAAHALYRGVIAALASAERLRLDPSRTSGDYARELRRRNSSALLPYRAFIRLFEYSVYGRGRCDADSLRVLIALAQPFRPRARAA